MEDDGYALPRPDPSRFGVYLGLAGAIVPFVFSYTTSESRSVNGVVVAAAVRNWTAIGGGIVALLAGLFALALIQRTPQEGRTKRLGVIAVVVGLGLYHLVVRSGLVL